jgi:GMP synthase-like glutamine amidotransferase
MKKVYIEYASAPYTRMFALMGYVVVSDPEQADFVCFTGGADVSPILYGDAVHRTTHSDLYRDKKEKRLFDWTMKNDKPKVGICRGGQFLNVMSGGRMYQDVTNHCTPHLLVDLESRRDYLVSSTHHQMMMPSDKAKVLAVADIRSMRAWFDGQVAKSDISQKGIEVVYYPHTNSLCFQPHPEFDGEMYAGMHRYFQQLLDDYIF